MQSGKLRVKADVHYKTEESMYEQINKKKAAANDDERSSSGNWSTASSSTGATSSTTTAKSPTQLDGDKDAVKPTSHSACCLSNGQPTGESAKMKAHHNGANRVLSSTESGIVQVRAHQQPANRAKFANRDSESWLQFFESNESTDTITNEMNDEKNSDARKAAQPNDAELKLKNCRFKNRPVTKNRSDSISSSNLEEHEDELLSIHSLDTDGYYTSMHTDSGLFRERAQQLPLNSTFLSADDEQPAKNESQPNPLNRPSQPADKLSPNKQQTKSFIDSLKKNGKSAPSPPPRSCSVMSSSSTLNNVQQLTSYSSVASRSQTDCDQDLQDSSSVCSDATLSGATDPSSQLNPATLNVPKATERAERQMAASRPSPANTWCSSSMNSDIDLVKLRTKTTIDATSAYPSMVAYPESELSSISSFGNLAFASSGNHRCTVISKSRSASDHQQFSNFSSNPYSSNTSYSNGHNHSLSGMSKKDSTSSLDSKMSKRSLSTIGSYASLTKLKELLKPLRNTLTRKSSEKKAKEEVAKKKQQSKDDCCTEETKTGKRKGFFTRFGSINRGRIVKSNHLEKLQSAEKAEGEQDDLIKLRNTINKWRIEPLSGQQETNKVLNKSAAKEPSKQQFAEEDENEYYAKLSQQSNNVLRNSVDYSLNNDLKRFSIASNHSQNGNVDCNSYLYKKHQQQQHSNLSASLNLPPNQSPANKENRRSADAALLSKYFPVSRYTSKVQPEPVEHQFIVPALPGPIYYENVANARLSYASSGCSNSLALSNNSALYASIPARPKTLNLSASLSTTFNQPIYGQTMLSNSYNGSFNSASLNRPFLANGQVISNSNSLNGLQFVVNGQSLNSSTSSSFYPANPMTQTNTSLPYPNGANFTNVNMLNNHPHLNQSPMYQTIHNPNQLNPHQQQQISSSSSHQSSSSLSYNYSASSSLVNTPSSLSSPSPFYQTSQTIKPNNINQFVKNLPNSATNTAIVSPFCKQTIQSTDSLKKSDEKLSESRGKRASDDSVLTRSPPNGQHQIMFRDSMRLTRQQREQTLARIHRSSWTPSSSMISSPSGSLESSSNSSTDQSAPCNDINKLISELSNFDARPDANQEEKKLLENQLDGGHQMNGKSDSIYGVNIARTKFSFPQLQNENAIKGDLNVLKQQSNGTDMDDFKRLLSSKSLTNGTVKKSASEQLKVVRKPLSALNSDASLVESAELNETGYYEKETYDNVTEEEYEHLNRADFRNNSSIISMMNGQANGQLNGFGSNLRTRVINGRVYKTPYRLEQMMYPPINENEEDNGVEDEFNLSGNTQQKTSTWV